MSKEIQPAMDLLGDPWTPPRDPRGRKRHKRTAEGAEKVAVLRAAGLKVEEIALRAGLSEPTLRKYYLRELEHADTLARSVLVNAMWQKAMDGSVAAARFIREELEKGAAAVPMSRQGARAPREERLGKKAQADVDARTAHEGTGWGGLLKH